MEGFLETACGCAGNNPGCVNCGGTGSLSVIACKRCRGRGTEGGRACLDCRGQKWRLLDQPGALS